jgi:hypothetical protein
MSHLQEVLGQTLPVKTETYLQEVLGQALPVKTENTSRKSWDRL